MSEVLTNIIRSRFKGVWDAQTSYAERDTVQYSGSLWYCKSQNSNVTPVQGAIWDLFISKGDTGDAGTGVTLQQVKDDADIADALTKKHASGSDNQDLSGKADVGHNHSGVYEPADSTILKDADIGTAVSAPHTHPYSADNHNHDAAYEAKNSNIQTHVGSAHAPSNAQKNSDITKAEIEAVLTGQLSSHSHAGGSEAFPVGSVFISVVSTNPGTLLGYGTWSAFGAGKTLIGLDSGDTDFDTAEETGGAKTINLAHTHDAHTAGRKGGTTNPQDAFNAPSTHASNLSATQSIVQPYIVTYFWKRTA